MSKKAIKTCFVLVLILSMVLSLVTAAYAENNPYVGQCVGDPSLMSAQAKCDSRHIDVRQIWSDTIFKADGTNNQWAFDYWLDDGISEASANGSIVHYTLVPAGDTPVQDINSGKLDVYLHTFGKELKAYGKPIIIRPMHECNLSKDSWKWCDVPAQDYINAFRRIYSILKLEEGATNVMIEFNVGDSNAGSHTYLEYYPGDAYCDFVGVDGYNWGATYPEWGFHWATFDEVMSKAYTAVAAIGKKVIISEFGTNDVKEAPGVHDASAMGQWLIDAYDTVRNSGKYDQIYMLLYFDVALSWPEPNAIDTHPESRAAYNQAVNFKSPAVLGCPNLAMKKPETKKNTISVDLGEIKDVNRVRLTWGDTYAQAYTVQVSQDNKNWTSIYSTTTGNGGLDDISGIFSSGRYVQIDVSKESTSSSASLSSFEVFGPTQNFDLNILYNGNFDNSTGKSGWQGEATSGTGTTAKKLSENGFNKGFGWCLKGNTDACTVIAYTDEQNRPTVTAGKKYTFGGCFKGAGSNLTVTVKWYDAKGKGKIISESSNKPDTTATTAAYDASHGWKSFSYNITAPANAVQAVVQLQSDGTSEVYFDNISLVEQP